jgi:PqqD family protein of HPr-rel-A system
LTHIEDQPHAWVAVTGVLLRCWEDECAAYEPRSGDTYVISPFAAEILNQLPPTAGLRPEQIATRLADWFEDETTPEDRLAIVNAHLAQIQRLRLISPVSTIC